MKKKILIAILIMVVIIIASVGGYFAYEHYENSKPIEQEWANTYYNFLKESKTNNESNTTQNSENNNIQNNSKIGFVDIEEVENPIMIVKYEKEEKQYSDIYFINDGEVNNIINLEPTDAEFLYNIETKQYDWYLHKQTQEEDIYKPIETQISERITELEKMKSDELNSENTANLSQAEDTITEQKEYTFKKGEEISVDTVDGNKLSISKFDTVFIKTDVNIDTMEYNENLSDKELKASITEEVKDYKTKEQVVTENIKQEVATKETEITDKQNEIKKAEEEVKKKQEEEQKKAEEEAKRKAEEEAAKGLKVGNYTLKYGKYVCDQQDSPAGGTYTINKDGTFSWICNWKNVYNQRYTDTAEGTYKVYFSNGDDYDTTKSWIIKFTYTKYHSTYEPSNSYTHDFTAFDVTKNNAFQYRQSEGTFTYQGN